MALPVYTPALLPLTVMKIANCSVASIPDVTGILFLTREYATCGTRYRSWRQNSLDRSVNGRYVMVTCLIHKFKQLRGSGGGRGFERGGGGGSVGAKRLGEERV